MTEPTKREGAPMRAVLWDVPPDIRAWRERTGADRWDEVWDGEIHMGPSPNRDHQDLQWQLETELRQLWVGRSGGRVHHDINVARPGRWPEDYRIPDLVLLLRDRFAIDLNEYFVGGPNAVVEIQSPGDESYAKLPFYADLDVREVWILHRDTRELELFALGTSGYAIAAPQASGWTKSAVTGLELRTHEASLELRWPDAPLEIARVP